MNLSKNKTFDNKILIENQKQFEVWSSMVQEYYKRHTPWTNGINIKNPKSFPLIITCVKYDESDGYTEWKEYSFVYVYPEDFGTSFCFENPEIIIPNQALKNEIFNN